MFKVGKFIKFNALKFEYVTGTNKTTFQKCLSDYNQQKKKKQKTIKYFKEYLLFYSHVTSNLILLDAKGTESLLSSNECFVKIRFYFPQKSGMIYLKLT